MPTVNEGESRKKFLSRCIPMLVDEGKSQKQAIAVCYSIYDEHKKKAKEMSQSQQSDEVKYLAASSGEFSAAVVMNTMPKRRQHPATRNTLPCFYYWKDAIEPGKYVHPTEGWEMDVTPDSIKTMSKNIDKMIGNGVEPPHVKDHRETADNQLGFIVGTKQGDDGKLYLLHQFLGEGARDTGLKNLVSLGVCNDFIDGKGRHYGLAIKHVAATPSPIVPNQGEFLKAASRVAADDEPTSKAATETTPQLEDKTMSTLLPEQLERYKKLIPGGDTITAENLHDKLLSHLQASTSIDDEDAGGPEAIKSMSRADISEKASGNRKTWKSESQRLLSLNTDLAGKVRELSSKVVKDMDPEAETLVIEAAKVKFDNLVGRGAISPAIKDQLFSLLVKNGTGKSNVLCLSRAANPGGDKPLAFAIADILAENRPVDLSERTDVQTLSRNVPDDKESENEKKLKNAQGMLDKYLGVPAPAAA